VITFAIPFYSGTDYLVRAIESILAQESGEWQALVCDDGPDASIEQVVREAGRGRVRYLRNPQNLGMARNWNRCIDVAETDLVTLLHGDDELCPGYAARMIEAMAAHPRAAAAFCRYEVIGPASEHITSLTDRVKDFINPTGKTATVLEGEAGMRALLRANFIAAPSLCYRKSILGERRFVPDWKFVLDWELTTRILLDGDPLVGLPERLLRYRRHPEQATEQLTRDKRRFSEEIEFYEKMRAAVLARGWTRCAAVARQKRLTKLHVAYRLVRSVARGELADARFGLSLLRDLTT
jgi:glycosyltransferase involved in cell wall biosynthesis